MQPWSRDPYWQGAIESEKLRLVRDLSEVFPGSVRQNKRWARESPVPPEEDANGPALPIANAVDSTTMLLSVVPSTSP